MKYRTIAPIILALSMIGFLVATVRKPYIPSVFVVRVPTEFKSNLTNLTEEELFEYLKTGEPLPIPEMPIPNFLNLHNCGTLLISLSSKGNIKINSQDIATLENTSPLTEKLNEVFREREEAGVYEENSDKIVKAVIIRAPRSAKYGEVAKLIDAVKLSGADPIVLQLDDLPQ